MLPIDPWVMLQETSSTTKNTSGLGKTMAGTTTPPLRCQASNVDLPFLPVRVDISPETCKNTLKAGRGGTGDGAELDFRGLNGHFSRTAQPAYST